MLGTGTGAPPPVHATLEAAGLIDAATASLRVLKDALPGYDVAIEAAKAQAAAVVRAEAAARWRQALDRHHAHARRIDQLCRDLDAAFAERQAGAEELLASWNADCHAGCPTDVRRRRTGAACGGNASGLGAA